MNFFYGYIIFCIFCVAIGVIADVSDFVSIDIGVVNNGYSSCTKAVDMRCDIYYEYWNGTLINMTNTNECIYVGNISGC